MQANGVLVDTSSWVDHLRHGSPALVALLEEGRVLCHPFVIGEFALGSLHQRQEILSLLTELPQAPVLDHDEAMALVDLHQLWSRGVGWIDVHLLGSAMLAGGGVMTADRRMRAIAADLGLSV